MNEKQATVPKWCGKRGIFFVFQHETMKQKYHFPPGHGKMILRCFYGKNTFSMSSETSWITNLWIFRLIRCKCILISELFSVICKFVFRIFMFIDVKSCWNDFAWINAWIQFLNRSHRKKNYLWAVDKLLLQICACATGTESHWNGGESTYLRPKILV